jgi:hypothetical protein
VTPSYLGNGKIYNKYVAIFHSRVFPRDSTGKTAYILEYIIIINIILSVGLF